MSATAEITTPPKGTERQPGPLETALLTLMIKYQRHTPEMPVRAPDDLPKYTGYAHIVIFMLMAAIAGTIGVLLGCSGFLENQPVIIGGASAAVGFACASLAFSYMISHKAWQTNLVSAYLESHFRKKARKWEEIARANQLNFQVAADTETLALWWFNIKEAVPIRYGVVTNQPPYKYNILFVVDGVLHATEIMVSQIIGDVTTATKISFRAPKLDVHMIDGVLSFNLHETTWGDAATVR